MTTNARIDHLERLLEVVRGLTTAPDRWWVEAGALAEAGLDTTGWPVQRWQDEIFVDVLAQAGASAALDEAMQSLRFTLPGTAWPARVYRQASTRARPDVPLSSVPRAFLDYSLYAGSGRDPVFTRAAMNPLASASIACDRSTPTSTPALLPSATPISPVPQPRSTTRPPGGSQPLSTASTTSAGGARSIHRAFASANGRSVSRSPRS